MSIGGRTRKKVAAPEKEEAVTEAPAVEIDQVAKEVEEFGATRVIADTDGTIKGLKPNTRYFVFEHVRGKSTVQFPPSAKLRAPFVRKSLLLTQEVEDPETNPIIESTET